MNHTTTIGRSMFAVALCSFAALGYAQLLYSFEDNLDGWGTSQGTLSESTTLGVTLGNKSMHWAHPSGYLGMSNYISEANCALMRAAEHKRFLIDVTILDGGGYWKQMKLIMNRANGGWIDQGEMTGLNYGLNGTQTVVVPWDKLTIPDDGEWRDFIVIFQVDSSGPATTDVYFDNWRLEHSYRMFSFEDDLEGFVSDPNKPEFVLSQGTTGATDGTKSLQVSWPGGFYWFGAPLSTDQIAQLNASPTKVLLFDVTTNGGANQWRNMRLAINDTLAGWREVGDFDIPGYNASNQKVTVAARYESLAPVDPSAASIALAVNGGTTAHTIWIDNVRVESDSTPAIYGTVVLNDWTGAVSGQSVNVEVREAGTTAVVLSASVTLDAGGALKVPIGSLTPGTYDVAIKASHWLRKVVSSVVVSASGAMGVNVSLENGDIDEDNSVTVFDYTALSDAFDTVPGDANWNAMADLDGDEAVTVFDYSILSDNFDMVGD